MCDSLGIPGAAVGNRQHFLRWDAGENPDHLQSAGFEYDSTGSHADVPGFRFGTARPFRMWSWQENKSIRLEQRPLIVMENTVIEHDYLGLGCGEKALQTMLELRNRTLEQGGDFTFLWHNSSLTTPEERDLYEKLLV
jgi:hypothetical protein